MRTEASRGHVTTKIPNSLRRDVQMLGSMLGTVLRERGGDELFSTVESIRRAAIRARHQAPGDSGASPPTLIDGLERAALVDVTRAFGAYFLLINIAEERQRLQRLRQRERREGRRPASLLD